MKQITVSSSSEIARVFDLLFIFKLYFNKDFYYDKLDSYDELAGGLKDYDDLLELIGTVPQSVMPFFYLNKDGICYMDKIFDKEAAQENISASSIVENIKTAVSTRYDLAKIFINNVTKAGIKNNIETISDQISGLNVSDSLKFQLLMFLLNPNKPLDTLVVELKSKEAILADFYKKRAAINAKPTPVAQDILLEVADEAGVRLDRAKNLTISLTKLSKGFMRLLKTSSGSILLMGSDYEKYINYLLDDFKHITLSSFGKAMNEPNRLQIIELLKKEIELSTTDIAVRTKLSLNNAYYHLSQMAKEKILSSRSEGRTVYYLINTEYFSNLAKEIERFMPI